MSDNESNQEVPNGVPPQGMHIRMDRYTVTNTRFPPTPGMPQMAPPGMGYIPPSYDGQQIPSAAPFSNFSFIPPPPVPTFPPSFPNPGMPFARELMGQMGMPMPPQFPVFVPVPTAPIPSQVPNPTGYVREPVFSSHRPRKDDKIAKKKRKPKDLPHKIKRSKRSSTPVRRRDDPNPAPSRSPSPPSSLARASGSNLGGGSHHSSEEEEEESDDGGAEVYYYSDSE